VEQGQLDLMHVQADEIRVKGRKTIVWMGLAMMVSTRLWLANALLEQVRRAAQILHPLLVLTDGWSAYPGSIRRAFREKVKETARRGRARLCIWPELHIGTVIKRSKNKCVVEITRKTGSRTLELAEHLLQRSRGGTMLNTAFIERLNATFRERLASLTRKSRHALARLVHGRVPDWLYLQFLRAPPGTFEREALGKGMHSGSGQWVDRSCVEFQ